MTAATSTSRPLPDNIPAYLEQLRASLAGADQALVQDALYDAEEYLRSELAENPGKSEAEVIAAVASSYGAPEEVADIYRDTEVKVQTALRSPKPAQPRSLLGRFFGVAVDPRAYAALFYMLLSLATGIFYFTWVTTGLSLSAGLLVLIVGIPFIILYFASVRVLSLVEGRMIEVMLGERMPRRPLYVDRGKPWLTRIKELFTDGRSWTTQLYFLLMLPLGVVYFTLAVTLLSTAAGLIAAPFLVWFGDATANIDMDGAGWMFFGVSDGLFGTSLAYWMLPLVLVVGVLLLFATLHLARGIGHLHAQIAKHLLVKIAPRV
jgi:uncharacterized membrane protein